MKAPPWVAALAFVLSGCLGVSPKLDPGQVDGTGDVFQPTTVEEHLERLPHFKVYGPTTIELEIAEVGEEGFGFSSSLLRIYNPVKANVHRLFNDPFLVAFIPLDLGEDAGSCNKLPKDLHFRFAPNQGRTNPGNLTGEYEKGWYHAVIVSTTVSSYRITFNQTTEQKIRETPGLDPFVTAGYKKWAGQRAYEESLPMTGTWLAMAQHAVGGNNLDGGREMSLSMTSGTECQSAHAKQDLTGSVVSREALSAHRLGVAGFGNGAAINLKASYKPGSESTAQTNTLLDAVWISTFLPQIAPPTSPPA